MEQLKRILRQALQEQAQRIKLQVGKPVELLTTQGAKPLEQEPVSDDPTLQKFYGFLFPNDKAALQSLQTTRGLLNIPNVGKILLIAQPAHPASLRFYLPPQGPELFESDWQRLSIVEEEAVSEPLPASGPFSGFIPPSLAAGKEIPVPSLAGAPARQPAANPVNPGQKGFVPPEMGNQGPIGLATGTPAVDASEIPRPPQPMTGAVPNAPVFAPSLASGAGLHAPPAVTNANPFLATPTDSGLATAGPFAVQPAIPLTESPQNRGQVATANASPFATPTVQAAILSAPVANPQLQAAGRIPGFDQFVPAAQMPFAQVASPQASWDHTSPPFAAGEPPPSADPIKINFGATSIGEADISEGQNPIDALLRDMVKLRASDLHMTCMEPLCFRIDGEIQRVGSAPLSPEQIESFLLPIMPKRNIEEFAKSNDTDFAYEVRGISRFRVNIFRDKNGVGAVMRNIPSKILTAEQLGLPPAITKFCALSKGLVVVTGPTGSGKSTTLAAMIDLINKHRHDHILTIEDPIEFVHPQQKCLVNQREVHKHTGSFARALKAALREDPDIVLIGEMRDLETVAIAIETAETGHLVFGTLHTNTAVSTVDRIINQFPASEQEQIRMMLASSLKGVIAQTLLKRKSGGRVAAHEILVSSDSVAAMIREGKNHMIPNHMQSQKGDGNILLNESLLKLVRENTVDVEDAVRKSVDKATFLEMLKRAGISYGGAEAKQVAAPPSGQPTGKRIA